MAFKKKVKKAAKKVVKVEPVKEEPKVVPKTAKVETIVCACGQERVSKTFCTNCGAKN